MLSFRKVAVFIALVGLMFGSVSVANAAHTRSHRRSTSSAGPVEMTGRRGAPEMILTGPIASVSPASGFIIIRHGAGKNAEEIPVEIDNKVSVTRGGSRLGADQLQAGERVRISYTGTPGDVSKTIEVLGGPGTRAGRARTRSMRSGSRM
jgi:hypothetical protein